MIPNFTKSPSEMLVDLINFTNGSSFTVGSLSFGIPTILGGQPKNTQLTVTAVEPAPNPGSVSIRYNRVDFENFISTQDKRFVVYTEGLLSDLVSQINARFGANLTPGDFVDALLTVDGSGNTQDQFVILAAEDNSLIFINDVQLTLERIKISIADAEIV